MDLGVEKAMWYYKLNNFEIDLYFTEWDLDPDPVWEVGSGSGPKSDRIRNTVWRQNGFSRIRDVSLSLDNTFKFGAITFRPATFHPANWTVVV